MMAFQTLKTLSYTYVGSHVEEIIVSSNHHSQDPVSNPLAVGGKEDPFA